MKRLLMNTMAHFGSYAGRALCPRHGPALAARLSGPILLQAGSTRVQHHTIVCAAADDSISRSARRISRRTKVQDSPQHIQQPAAANTEPPPAAAQPKHTRSKAAAANTSSAARAGRGADLPANANQTAQAAAQERRTRSRTAVGSGGGGGSGGSTATVRVQGPQATVTQSLPKVLILHTGGTLGMDVAQSYEASPQEDPYHPPVLKRGTGGSYGGLVPGVMLNKLFSQVPELCTFANLDLQVVFNKDSSNVGPKEWVQIAKLLDKNRQAYDAFLVVHGTDTMAYTASALSLMLAGFKKPIVMTGSQLPLTSPRSDARQNLIDALTCATCAFNPPHAMAAPLNEVAVCFGGRLMRGNRAQKVDSSNYQAFDSPGFPHLASLGVDIEWNERYMLRVEGGYVPRFKLDSAVIRLPIVPGSDPRVAYGDLLERGVKGVVLEAFGVGNFPDLPQQGWVPWLRQQTRKGLKVYLASQCHLGLLRPELYKSGALAMEMGVEAGPQMTPECAVVKMMLCLAYPDLPLGQPLAGEL